MRRLSAILAAGLWLAAAGHAWALDLGAIEVGSLRGEPLMARIALVDPSDGDLGKLKVELGGREDFVRAGIERHDHLLTLEFEVVVEGSDSAHVMIRGRDPVDSSFTTFLVEAAWPEGRVLREYTVLLDAVPPETTTSYGPVRSTDTLWSLARRFRPEGISVQRMMLAMLARNPHAFAIGNVNALREGAVLEIPASVRIGADDKASAIEEVLRQNRAWQDHVKSAGAPLVGAEFDAPESVDMQAATVSGEPAPEETMESRETPESADAQAATGSGEPAPEMMTESREASDQAQDAELRVVVPGTAQSVDTGREQALRDELDLALEEADSRRQEIVELSARLDEAEQLIFDLQRLVELKDDDIAGLQRRLAQEAAASEIARSEVAEQARSTAQAREEALIQAEMAEVAQAESLARAESAATAPAEGLDAQAEIADSDVAEAEFELLPELEPELEQEEDAVAALGAGAAVEALPAGLEDAEDAASDESAAPPGLLRTLEEILGFSPVVGGVGLVGVILILGGLIALMRRRSSARDDADEEDASPEDDTASDFWGDEADLEEEALGLGEEGLGFAEEEGVAAPSSEPAPGDASRPTGAVPDVDEFDIGIDLDEELTRALEEQLESDSGVDRGTTALERAIAPVEESLGGPSSGRTELASAVGDEDVAVDLGDDLFRATEEGGAGLEGKEPHASGRRAGAAGPLEGAVFPVGEGLAGDVDELQTKLDLAQTYIDMEDFENARGLLREVQAQGGLEQRAIARYLSGKLP